MTGGLQFLLGFTVSVAFLHTSAPKNLTGLPLDVLRDTAGYNIGETGSNLFVVDIIRPKKGPCFPESIEQDCYILDSVGLVQKNDSGFNISNTSVIVQEDIDVVLDCASKRPPHNFTWRRCISDQCDALSYSDMKIEPDMALDSKTGNLIIFKLAMNHSGVTYACFPTDSLTGAYSWRFFIYVPKTYYEDIIILCVVSVVLFFGASALLLRDYIVYERRYTLKDEGELVPLASHNNFGADTEQDVRKRSATAASKEEVEMANIAEPVGATASSS